jgi:hypothetical protein
MNPELQLIFEKEVMDCNITDDRTLFNKDKKGVYLNHAVFFMYRIWVLKQAEIEGLKESYERKLEETFMCGYTEAEFDFRSIRSNVM